MSTTQSATSGGALAQLLTINQRQPQTQMQSKPKPQHPNLITRIRPTASSASASSSFSSAAALPPRHPTLERNAGDKDKPTTHSQQQQQQQQRVSPVSGMSSSSHQSAKQKALFLWRRRLWPSLAPFYRILLRCHCKFTPTPSSSTGALADKDQGQEQDTFLEMRQGEMALEWGSFWDPAALAPLSLHFSRSVRRTRNDVVCCWQLTLALTQIMFMLCIPYILVLFLICCWTFWLIYLSV